MPGMKSRESATRIEQDQTSGRYFRDETRSAKRRNTLFDKSDYRTQAEITIKPNLFPLRNIAREGVHRSDITERLAGLAGADRIRFFDMPRLDISSSMIRHRVAAGRPIRFLVPDAVAAYIEETGLYQEGSA